MLDTKLNAWLLEVNLSPGCGEGVIDAQWMIDMLDRSADGLFDIIEQKLNNLTDDF